jgi:hypothetical protein
MTRPENPLFKNGFASVEQIEQLEIRIEELREAIEHSRRLVWPDEEPAECPACRSPAACGTPNDPGRGRFRRHAGEAQAQRNGPAEAQAPSLTSQMRVLR